MCSAFRVLKLAWQSTGGVLVLPHHLGRDERRGATKGLLHRVRDHGEVERSPEVGELHLALHGDQHVGRLARSVAFPLSLSFEFLDYSF